MKQSEGILKEFTPELYQKKVYAHCPYCGDSLTPGLMNIAKHWLECGFNPTVLKALERKSPLIDEIKKQIKF